MRRIRYRKVRKVQPANIEYTGPHRTDPVEMQLFVYDDQHYLELQNEPLETISSKLEVHDENEMVKWLNVHGLHDQDLIQRVGSMLRIESYMIGDILNTSGRTRIEELDELLFFSVKSILQEQDTDVVKTEQISFVMRGNLLVSFQEKRSDFFTHIRERIRTKTGAVRRKSSDYLLYLLLEAIMENFYITIDNNENVIEELMAQAKSESHPEILARIEKNRENLNFLKRSVVPLRDALFNLKSREADVSYGGIRKDNYFYFARLHQKSLEILDQIEYDMNSLESASNIFFSSQSQRMNQIMKTLTIFSVIFMPLTFIAGIYGMNFENMPELRMVHGYYVVWIVMIVIALIMTVYFKKKRWF